MTPARFTAVVALTGYQLLEVYPAFRNQRITRIDSGVLVADGHGWELTVGQSDDGGARFDVRT